MRRRRDRRLRRQRETVTTLHGDLHRVDRLFDRPGPDFEQFLLRHILVLGKQPRRDRDHDGEQQRVLGRRRAQVRALEPETRHEGQVLDQRLLERNQRVLQARRHDGLRLEHAEPVKHHARAERRAARV